MASETIVNSGAKFPRLIASNLEKRTFTLPDDFEGSRNLLLVAFQREQQQQAGTVCGVRRFGAALSEQDFFLSYNKDFRYSRLRRAMNFTLMPLGHAAWHS